MPRLPNPLVFNPFIRDLDWEGIVSPLIPITSPGKPEKWGCRHGLFFSQEK